MKEQRFLTTGAAAHVMTEVTGRPYGPGTLRYYETIGRLRAERTTTGVRLFRESDVRHLATVLAERRAP
jgi:hypothetical protein